MAADRPSDNDHRVVPFRPRRPACSASRGWRLARATQHPPPPVEGLAKYEGGRSEDDYRHRMMVNLAALAFTVLLAGAGVWLTIQIADMRKNQDWVFSGRSHCAPVDVKGVDR